MKIKQHYKYFCIIFYIYIVCQKSEIQHEIFDPLHRKIKYDPGFFFLKLISECSNPKIIFALTYGRFSDPYLKFQHF